MILFGNYGDTGYAPYQGRITNLAIFGKKHLRLFLSIDGVELTLSFQLNLRLLPVKYKSTTRHLRGCDRIPLS